MGLFYKSSNIYLVKIGVSKKSLQEGSISWGVLEYTKHPEIFVAELTGTLENDRIFKLLSSNRTISDSDYCVGSGTMFVCASIPFNEKTNNQKNFLSKNYLLNYEKEINKSIKPSERLDIEKSK